MAFVVHVDAAGNPDFACSGSLISSNVVMTAGHCAIDDNTGAQLDPGGFGVVTGAVDWSDAGHAVLTLVSRVVVNPGYDSSTGVADAALLVLSTPASAPSIRLAVSADRYLEQVGTGASIAGWGLVDSTAGGLPTTLQWAPTVVQSADYCGQFDVSPFVYDPAFNLCSLDYPQNDTSFCNGDSGGPLVASDVAGHPVEIGVINFTSDKCYTDQPDFYAKVRSLSGWANGWIRAVAPAGALPIPPPPLSSPYFGNTAQGQPMQASLSSSGLIYGRYMAFYRCTKRGHRTSYSSPVGTNLPATGFSGGTTIDHHYLFRLAPGNRKDYVHFVASRSGSRLNGRFNETYTDGSHYTCRSGTIHFNIGQ